MKNTLESKVAEAYEKYGLAYDGPPRHLKYEEMAYRIACLQEEVNELAEAETLIDKYDACLDLIVFAVGTLYRMGMPLQEGFDAVMNCNLQKVPGNNPHKSDKARADYKGIDLVKPEGWRGPEDDLVQILVKHSLEKAEV